MAQMKNDNSSVTNFEVMSKSDAEKGIADLRKNIIDSAHNIVHNIFPRKVLKLNDIFEHHPQLNMAIEKVEEGLPVAYNAEPIDPKDADHPTKKRKIGSTTAMDEASDPKEAPPLIPSNKIILQLLGLLKKELLEIIEMINTVKLWIQLNIPRIEDGNNFGVSIQEETVNELGRAEDAGFAVLESMTKYFVTRAKLVSKVLKYPTIQDYRQSVIELDEKEFINLRMCCMDLRNNYAILHDMILKNLEKIKTPRSSNHMAHIF